MDNWRHIKMKKILIILGIAAAFIAITAFTIQKNTKSGSGDGVTTCEVYGADGYIAKVVEKVITPSGNNALLPAKVKLNQKNKTDHVIKIVVELRNSYNSVIESQTITISQNSDYGWLNFNHKGNSGEVYYITINSASCS